MLKLKLVKGALCSFGEDTLMSRERSSLADQLNKVTLQTLPPLSLQTMMSWELIFQEQNAVAQQAAPVQIPTPRWAELSWAACQSVPDNPTLLLMRSWHGGLCHQWGPCDELETCPGSTLPSPRDSWDWLQHKPLRPHQGIKQLQMMDCLLTNVY